MSTPQPEMPMADTRALSEATEAPDGTTLAIPELYRLVRPEQGHGSVTETETPNSNKLITSTCCHLVHVRLGRLERSVLLANTETWTPYEEWNQIKFEKALRKTHAPLSRAIYRLVRLKLVETDYSQVYSPDDDGTNTQLITRRIQAGEQTYKRGGCRITRHIIGQELTYRRRYIQTRYLRLTPLGAAVVDQFRVALASGKRIRWARFKPPSLPPEPPPAQPEPVKLSPEQEELRLALNSLHLADWHQSFLTSQVEQAREAAAELPKLEAAFAAVRSRVEAGRQRIAELRARGVALPEDQSEPDASEGRTDETIRDLEPPEGDE
jgi:hypothetical protein